jgi:hypothetical protein
MHWFPGNNRPVPAPGTAMNTQRPAEDFSVEQSLDTAKESS